MNSYFEELFTVNVNDKVEKKNGLSYVSWAFAWGELKKHFPKSFYTVYENENGWPYFTDGHTCWVKTGVTVVQSEVVRDPDGNLYGEDFGRLEHIEYLPIMDFRNNSIPADKVTSTDVNKAIQRSLTKEIARHGLGLYIYAGEDLPEGEEIDIKATPVIPAAQMKDLVCESCSNPIQDIQKRDGSTWFASDIAAYTKKRYGKCLCGKCAMDAKKAAS